ncbi:fumarylacetoacetate hydrolase family protein [Nocardioides sp. NPDC059952]|uniref:fumarylacetoacetate hydrolase family protein n=1 Tax=Nocardioides sp. NPDC059952 TaxID=3347014 RepID=UPI00364F0CB8
MRIARFTTKGGEPQFGVVMGDLDGYGQLSEDATVVALQGDPLFSGVNITDQVHKFEDVKLLAPVIPRSKVVAVARNYAKHAAELGNEVPAEPLFFIKPNTAVCGPGDTIQRPAGVEDLHFEGELAIVIGRICRDVPEAKVKDVIYGMTVANDVTARDVQRRLKHFSQAKGYDTFCPLGPWIETDVEPEQLAAGVRIQTFLNGDVVQDGSTKDLVHDIPKLIAHISSVMTLLPGDVILTGTPEGVGPMEPGDEIEIFVEGLGALTNKVAQR